MPNHPQNYYDDQFNGRINDIAKSGSPPPSSTSSSGSSFGTGWGARGIGGLVVFVIFVGLRILFFAGRTTSTYTAPTYQYTPPPSYQYTPPANQQNQWRNDWNQDKKEDPFNK